MSLFWYKLLYLSNCRINQYSLQKHRMIQDSPAKDSCSQESQHQKQAPTQETPPALLRNTRNSSIPGIDHLRNLKRHMATWTIDEVLANSGHESSRVIYDGPQGMNQKACGELGFQVLMFVVAKQCKSVITDFKASFCNKTKSVILDDGIEAIVPEMVIRKMEQKKTDEIPLKTKKNHFIFEQNKQNTQRFNCEDSWSVDNYKEKIINAADIPNTSVLEYGDSVVDEPSSLTHEAENTLFKIQSDDNEVSQLDQAFVDENGQQSQKPTDSPVALKKICQNQENEMQKPEANAEVTTPLLTQINDSQMQKLENNNTLNPLNEKDQKIQQPEKILGPCQTEIVEELTTKTTKNIPNHKIKQTEWFKQLSNISYAQTELTYLCQHLDWTVRFSQGNAEVGVEMFCGKTEVSVIKGNNFVRYHGICVAEKSKKEARHSSAIVCLAELYLNVEGLWQNYKKLKEENPSLYQPMKSNNAETLKNWLQERIDTKEKLIKLEEDEDKFDYRPDVDEYVNSLQSCKKELYYFVAQNNKVFMNPKWLTKRRTVRGEWQVECYVRYEIKEKIYEFRQKNFGKNRKQSEEKVSKDLLRNIYRDFPSMYKKFKKMKTERAFI